ncbi:hypothetical protein SDC9_161058 [bioreactor metagenome]|uniref:Uncharacterized protein n=1 Tax=bioreactor metagenome TaxID=1076179 RepID=A0A645FN32_9ZZZZ
MQQDEGPHGGGDAGHAEGQPRPDVVALGPDRGAADRDRAANGRSQSHRVVVVVDAGHEAEDQPRHDQPAQPDGRRGAERLPGAVRARLWGVAAVLSDRDHDGGRRQNQRGGD